MWQYYSENISGNLHQTVPFLNMLAKEHPEHEIVALESNGYNSIVVYRTPTPITITIRRPK